MENQNKLNSKILAATQKIHDVFPDLNRYLDEMPEDRATPVHSSINNADLEDYLDSLNGILNSTNKK